MERSALSQHSTELSVVIFLLHMLTLFIHVVLHSYDQVDHLKG